MTVWVRRVEYREMNEDRDSAEPTRFAHLAEKMRDKVYRDRYVESHTRRFLARQMREFRGDKLKNEFATIIDKKPTIVSRLEDPSYSGWTLRTLFEIARKLDVAVIVRFVGFRDFVLFTDKMDKDAIRPPSFDAAALDTPLPTVETIARAMYRHRLEEQHIYRDRSEYYDDAVECGWRRCEGEARAVLDAIAGGGR